MISSPPLTQLIQMFHLKQIETHSNKGNKKDSLSFQSHMGVWPTVHSETNEMYSYDVTPSRTHLF